MLRQTDLELKVILLLFPDNGLCEAPTPIESENEFAGNAFRSFVFPLTFQLKDVRNVLNAANSRVFRFLFLVSQASDVRSKGKSREELQARKLVRAIEKRFVETWILELRPECGES